LANHRSAVKRYTQSEKKRQRNKAYKSELRTATKKVVEATTAGNTEEATKNLKVTTVLLDKAVTKNVLHRNNAARRISRLTKAVNSIATS
jgi:small subunit ribosomal protein S20